MEQAGYIVAAALREEAQELWLGRSQLEAHPCRDCGGRATDEDGRCRACNGKASPGPDPLRIAAGLRSTAASLRRLARKAGRGHFAELLERDARQHERQAAKLEGR